MGTQDTSKVVGGDGLVDGETTHGEDIKAASQAISGVYDNVSDTEAAVNGTTTPAAAESESEAPAESETPAEDAGEQGEEQAAPEAPAEPETPAEDQAEPAEEAAAPEAPAAGEAAPAEGDGGQGAGTPAAGGEAQ